MNCIECKEGRRDGQNSSTPPTTTKLKDIHTYKLIDNILPVNNGHGKILITAVNVTHHVDCNSIQFSNTPLL